MTSPRTSPPRFARALSIVVLARQQNKFHVRDASIHKHYLVRVTNIQSPILCLDREFKIKWLRKAGPGRETVDDRRDEEDVLSALDHLRRALQENGTGQKLLDPNTLLVRDRQSNTVIVGDVLLPLFNLGDPDGDAFGGSTMYVIIGLRWRSKPAVHPSYWHTEYTTYSGSSYNPPRSVVQHKQTRSIHLKGAGHRVGVTLCHSNSPVIVSNVFILVRAGLYVENLTISGRNMEVVKLSVNIPGTGPLIFFGWFFAAAPGALASSFAFSLAAMGLGSSRFSPMAAKNGWGRGFNAVNPSSKEECYWSVCGTCHRTHEPPPVYQHFPQSERVRCAPAKMG